MLWCSAWNELPTSVWLLVLLDSNGIRLAADDQEAYLAEGKKDHIPIDAILIGHGMLVMDGPTATKESNEDSSDG